MTTTKNCTCQESVAIASVPKQEWCTPYDLTTALKEGTLFPCLNLTFFKAPEGKSNCKTCSDTSNSKQKDRETMLSRLSCVSFALNDLTLYLDTHPHCEEGLTLFYRLLEERLSLLSDFAKEFYPLTQISMITGDFSQAKYGWAEGPMPWEGGCI